MQKGAKRCRFLNFLNELRECFYDQGNPSSHLLGPRLQANFFFLLFHLFAPARNLGSPDNTF